MASNKRDVLNEQCGKVIGSVRSALEWIADTRNDRKVQQERSALLRSFRRDLLQVEKLQRSIERPSCIAIFGPSQAGKSYLVSRLGGHEDSLVAKFDGDRPEIPFLEINPGGGKEATGLVTRFTLQPEPTPPGFPVCLRLLTQSDLVKLLANSCYNDATEESLVRFDSMTLESHLKAFEDKAASTPVDGLREEDIWDVEEYSKTCWRSDGHPARAFDPYWERLSNLVPRVQLPDRGHLLAPLWGGHTEFTELFIKLAEALKQLNFEEEAYCGIESLIPSATGIINVEALAELDSSAPAMLRISTRAGRAVELPRAVITAIAKELRIVCRDKPWPFFEHTDVLDFPGYRSRARKNLTTYFKEDKGNAVTELLKRSKVEYLFQRYTADFELTSMILCLRDGPLEVVSLAEVVEDWISVTHGPTPESRVGRPSLLFWALTHFDLHLSDKAGDAGRDDSERFDSRLDSSLLQRFAPYASSWPRKWQGDQPFQNCFWIRNPNVEVRGIFEYDANGKELQIRADREQRLAELARGHANATHVRTHFKDPDRAWAEALRLNDGGVSYLAESLSEVCSPDLKLDQVRSRLKHLCRQMHNRIARHYVAEDLEKRLAERRVVAERIIADLMGCRDIRRFGSLLRRLCVSEAELFRALLDELYRPQSSSRDSMAAQRESFAPGRPGARNSQLALRALQHWNDVMSEAAADAAFARKVGVSQENLLELTTELASAARNCDLLGRILNRLQPLSNPIEMPESVALKGATVAQRIINDFVGRLDYDLVPSEQRPRNNGTPIFLERPIAYDAQGIAPEPVDFTDRYADDWISGFRRLVETNATSKDGFVEDPEQNAKLGSILGALEAVSAA